MYSYHRDIAALGYKSLIRPSHKDHKVDIDSYHQEEVHTIETKLTATKNQHLHIIF